MAERGKGFPCSEGPTHGKRISRIRKRPSGDDWIKRELLRHQSAGWDAGMNLCSLKPSPVTQVLGAWEGGSRGGIVEERWDQCPPGVAEGAEGFPCPPTMRGSAGNETFQRQGRGREWLLFSLPTRTTGEPEPPTSEPPPAARVLEAKGEFSSVQSLSRV